MNCASCESALPPNARFCPTCGTPSAPPAATTEERKLVTVVFCDLVGSTPLSEALDPETLRSVTLRYFTAMRKPIERYGGTVEKFIGDAVMAVFGVPVMHEDDARRAALAATGMLAALAELNADLDASLGVQLRVRIGVNTGPAVTGTDVATRQAMVSGETVNVAARLEQNAGAGEILIGPLTRQALGAAARTDAGTPFQLKGKAEPVMAYRLLGVDGDDPEVLRRFDVPFVGRTDELAELDRALAAVAAGGGSRRLTVYGEPGIGKTRLIRTWLDRAPSPVVAGSGRCRPYRDRGSLAPLADALDDLLTGTAGDGAAGQAGTGGRQGDTEALAVLRTGLLRDGTPGPSSEATCAAIARLLDGMATTRRPVVLTLDDCQWASDPLLDLVDALIALTARSAVLVVCLGRLELLDRRPDWGTRGTSHTLLLPGLPSADCELIVASLAEVSAHLAGTSARIVEVAAGNPFYLEQLLAAVSESGSACPLPHSVQSLIGARIDALGQAERTALDLAAVLGREFTPGAVAALASAGPEGQYGGPLAARESGTGASANPVGTGADAVGIGADPVGAALAGLSRRRLVHPARQERQERQGSQLRFSNSLIHETTYRAMAKRTRAERHERAAEVLATWHTANATIAGHLERAYRYRSELGLLDGPTDALRRRAAALLSSAGGQALGRSDLAWAGALLGRAVELSAPHEAHWAGAARQLAEVRIATGDVDAGRSLLQAVLDLSSNPVEIAHARLALAVADRGATAGTATAAVARETLPVFQAAGDDLGQARACIRLAQEHQLHGQHGQAEALLGAALRHADRQNAEPELAQALGAVGISLWRGPVPVPVAIDRCRELLAAYGPPRPVVRATLNCPLAVLLALDDQPDAARAGLAEARKLAQELGYAEGQVVIPIFAAAVESLAGEVDRALRLLEAAAAVAGGPSSGLGGAIAREAARLLLDSGDYAAATARLAGTCTAADLLRSDAADLDGLRARLAAADGSASLATELAARASATAATTDSPIVAAIAALDRAAILDELGLLDEAAAAVDTARSRLAEKGHRPGMRQADEFLARLAARREGRPRSSRAGSGRTDA